MEAGLIRASLHTPEEIGELLDSTCRSSDLSKLLIGYKAIERRFLGAAYS
jgi:hypothetical protein